jgi:hypothetical protein
MAQVTDDNGQTRFENAKTAAASFVQAVADGDDDSVRVGLLTFGNANQVGEVSSPPADFGDGVYGVEVVPSTDLASLATTVAGLNTHESGSNGTGTGSALAAVGVDDAYFDFDDDRKKYVIVVTDGEPNRDDPDAQTGDFLTPGPLNYPESRAYGVEQADALRDDGVRVVAIGVGALGGDAETFVENVGGDDPANYYFTGGDPSLVDYTSIFESILDELASCPEAVHIDVKYGSDPNGINPNSNGNIPVTVFGSDEFDVRDIDLSTMRFGPADVVADGGGASLDHGDYTDQDGDGDEDFVGHFLTRETGIEMGDTVLWLYFETADGTAFVGCDSAKTVGGGRDDDRNGRNGRRR